MISYLFKFVYKVVLIGVIISIISIIFNSFLDGYYQEILGFIKPGINSLIPYFMDYQTAVLVAEFIIFSLSLNLFIMFFNFFK